MDNQQENDTLQTAVVDKITWINDHLHYIAWIFYALLIAGSGYWIYQLIIIDVQPQANLPFSTKDTKDALVIMVFGIFLAALVCIIGFFLLKFICNLFLDGINNIFPIRAHSLVKSISCLAILGVAFLFIGNVKATGLTAYKQVTEVLHVAQQHDEVTVENYKRKVELERKLKDGNFDDFFKN